MSANSSDKAVRDGTLKVELISITNYAIITKLLLFCA